MPYADPEKYKAYQQAYREAHREENKARCKAYALEHSKELLAYREARREDIKKWNAKWRKENPGYAAKWREDNREWHRKYKAEYARRQRKEDPNFKLTANLSRRIRIALKGGIKSARTRELLGCEIEFLRTHIEKQFQPGMTWENYSNSVWHIDHKRPCASFDLTDPKQQQECFHFSNLQPLWAKDNLYKGDTYGDS